MNRNLALIVGLGAFGVLVVALLLRKGPTNFAFGDIGSKLSLPSLGAGMSDAETKSAIGAALADSTIPKLTDAKYQQYAGRGTAAAGTMQNLFRSDLAAWLARNP